MQTYNNNSEQMEVSEEWPAMFQIKKFTFKKVK